MVNPYQNAVRLDQHPARPTGDCNLSGHSVTVSTLGWHGRTDSVVRAGLVTGTDEHSADW